MVTATAILSVVAILVLGAIIGVIMITKARGQAKSNVKMGTPTPVIMRVEEGKTSGTADTEMTPKKEDEKI